MRDLNFPGRLRPKLPRTQGIVNETEVASLVIPSRFIGEESAFGSTTAHSSFDRIALRNDNEMPGGILNAAAGKRMFLTTSEFISYLSDHEFSHPSPPSPSCAQHVGGGVLR
jgi:hypothetical protein